MNTTTGDDLLDRIAAEQEAEKYCRVMLIDFRYCSGVEVYVSREDNESVERAVVHMYDNTSQIEIIPEEFEMCVEMWQSIGTKKRMYKDV